MSSPTLSAGLLPALVRTYVVVAVATVAVLALLSVVDPAQATPEAWGHAVVVLAFAVLLPLRLRAARRGSTRAARAVVVVAAVLLVVNLVEALLPGVFPGWMRIEMVGIAVLMGAVVVAGLRVR